MKKAKKLISLLLALTMLLGIIPMAMAAETTVNLGRTKLDDAILEKGTPSSFSHLRDMKDGSAAKGVGETGFWQRLPRNTVVGYGTVTPVNYAVPKEGSVTVSNEGVIGDFSFSLEPWAGNEFTTNPPCLQFNYTALAVGSTTVTVKYYYNYGLINIQGGRTWYEETATFTINVNDGDINKPSKPTVDDVKRFRNYVNTTSSSLGAVYMWCDTYDHQAWFDYITEVDDAYTLGDVVANDGSVLSKYTYPWVCVMTLDANKYLDAYNYEFDDEWGTHYLKDGQAATETATWYWNADLSKWQFRSSEAPIYIDITHTAPTPEVTEYTVTYKDGVDGAAFVDQTYTVKENDPTPAFEGEPTREGYVFLGWEPEVAETVTGDATYVATWELETYTITYDFRKVVKTSDVKNLNNPTTFTIEDLPLTLKAPTFKNNEWPQKFLNWRDVDGNVVTEITEPGDITLCAYYQYPVRYRVYDEDGKVVEALTVIDWYNEDDFASYEVRPATVDMPGYELDGWYQTLKDAGNVNKRFGSLYMAKKYELVGKLNCCINVTVEVNGETVNEQKFTGAKGGTPDYRSLYSDIVISAAADGSLVEYATYIDGERSTGTLPVFGTNANVRIVITTASIGYCAERVVSNPIQKASPPSGEAFSCH